MKHLVGGVLVALAICFGGQFTEAETPYVYASSRKMVTVFASNATEARATAERQNPGWRVVSVSPAAPNDPLSRAWRVTLEKQ